MATKNLKVLMSGDTKPYRAEVDLAAKATKTMKDDIGSHLNSIAGLFGTSTSSIGQSAQKVSLIFSGLVASFSTAAAGGTAFAVASAQVTAAGNALAQAEARVVVASAALVTAQTTAGVSAEALAAAELEATAAAAALATAQGSLAVAQKAATAATGLGTIAMQIFKVALVSTGIGALIVVLGSLIAYFSSTREGAAKIKVAMAEIGAVVNVLKDRFSSLGEGLYKFFTGDFKGAAKALGGLFTGLGQEMVAEASAAGDLAKKTQALNKEERENIVLQQERMTKAAQLRNDAKQEGVDANDKKRMLQEAKNLIIEYYNEEKHIAEGRRDIAAIDSSMHKNMEDELTALEEAKAKVLAIDQESAEAQKALSREMKAANKEIAAQTEALIKKNIEQRKEDNKGIKTYLGKGVGLETQFTELSTKPKEQTDAQKKSYQDAVEANNKYFDKNLAKTYQMSDAALAKHRKEIDSTKLATIDLASSLNGAMGDLAGGIGETLGSLLSGEGSFRSFGTMVASIFADMAINVGKMAIGTGLAVSGIKAALKSLNPYVAIAAGIALVALGSAIKGGLSSVASGGSSGGGTSGDGNYNYDTRTSIPQATAQKISVEVSGTLEASAKGLSTTLSKENTRVQMAT